MPSLHSFQLVMMQGRDRVVAFLHKLIMSLKATLQENSLTGIMHIACTVTIFLGFPLFFRSQLNQLHGLSSAFYSTAYAGTEASVPTWIKLSILLLTGVVAAALFIFGYVHLPTLQQFAYSVVPQ